MQPKGNNSMIVAVHMHDNMSELYAARAIRAHGRSVNTLQTDCTSHHAVFFKRGHRNPHKRCSICVTIISDIVVYLSKSELQCSK